jgi:hypothetical protein
MMLIPGLKAVMSVIVMRTELFPTLENDLKLALRMEV